jgi:hypothetical protein
MHLTDRDLCQRGQGAFSRLWEDLICGKPSVNRCWMRSSVKRMNRAPTAFHMLQQRQFPQRSDCLEALPPGRPVRRDGRGARRESGTVRSRPLSPPSNRRRHGTPCTASLLIAFDPRPLNCGGPARNAAAGEFGHFLRLRLPRASAPTAKIEPTLFRCQRWCEETIN